MEGWFVGVCILAGAWWIGSGILDLWEQLGRIDRTLDKLIDEARRYRTYQK